MPRESWYGHYQTAKGLQVPRVCQPCPRAGVAKPGPPNGDVWVLRSHRAGDAAVFDVFGPSSTLIAQVALPPRSRLIGFGNGTAYLVRRDDDDLEHLQRYRLQ